MAGGGRGLELRWGIDLADQNEIVLTPVMSALGRMTATHARCEMELAGCLAVLLSAGDNPFYRLPDASALLEKKWGAKGRAQLVSKKAREAARAGMLSEHGVQRFCALAMRFEALSEARNDYVHRPLGWMSIEGSEPTLVLVRPSLLTTMVTREEDVTRHYLRGYIFRNAVHVDEIVALIRNMQRWCAAVVGAIKLYRTA